MRKDKCPSAIDMNAMLLSQQHLRAFYKSSCPLGGFYADDCTSPTHLRRTSVSPHYAILQGAAVFKTTPTHCQYVAVFRRRLRPLTQTLILACRLFETSSNNAVINYVLQKFFKWLEFVAYLISCGFRTQKTLCRSFGFK